MAATSSPPTPTSASPKNTGGKGLQAKARATYAKSSKKLTFDTWVQKVYIPMSEDDPGGWQLDFSADNATAIKNITQGVKYCDDEEHKAYVITVRGGLLFNADDELFHTGSLRTEFSGDGWAIFVMAPDNTLYSASHLVDKFHHSSFLSGARVQAAGEIAVNSGRLECITPKTGHYKTGDTELTRILFFLRTKGVKLEHVAACPKPFVTPLKWYQAEGLLKAGLDPTGMRPVPLTPRVPA